VNGVAAAAAAAAAAAGAAPADSGGGGGGGGGGGRQVLQLDGLGEVLLCKPVLLPGARQQLMQVEVLDLVATDEDSSSASRRRGLCAGAAGVLLLVSGPDPGELSAAVQRLRVVLEQLAPAPAVPLVVLACSGEPS